jgi:hypothetical protein
MHRLPALALALVLGLSPAAGATPISTVGSATGEEDVSNQMGRGGWMPQVAANLVFRETLPGIDERSLEAVAKLGATPLSIQVTTLYPGIPRLTFSDRSEYYVSTRASFMTSIP